MKILKITYLIISYFCILTGLSVIKTRLSLVQDGEFSSVLWMSNPIMIISILILFLRIPLENKIREIFRRSIHFISIKLIRYKRIYLAIGVFFNIVIFVLFLNLATYGSGLIMLGVHLLLCNIYDSGLLLIGSGFVLSTICVFYFNIISFRQILCSSIEYKKIYVLTKRRMSNKTGIKATNFILQFFGSNKQYLLPFNKGINRLLTTIWILLILYVELLVDNSWKYNTRGLYGYGLIPLFVLPTIYLIIIWIYHGFKESSNTKNN